jgi:glycosyltransferase involved in cell wall biosynthesis/lipopolysaccharide biosynthesis glycosyltransferase
MMTTMPVAGIVWLTIPYLVGLRRLGYDVYYVEAHARTPSMLMSAPEDDGAALAADFIDRVMRRFGFGQSWAYHALHADGRVYGLSEPALQKLYRSADLLFNLHGGTDPLPEHRATGRLVLIETDPVELEIELHRGDERARDFLDAHSAVFTWGTNFGHPGCRVPLPVGHDFHTSRMPVLIDQWRLPEIEPRNVFTTVGNWQQAWRDVEFEGETYRWSKHHEFEKFLELPRRTSGQLELALASCDDATRQRLCESGWQVRTAADVSSDVDVYRRYIVSSRAEFTVAKDQNVRLQSGWFSDRSAAYLAASRPVITQETGFSNSMPVGEGLFAFSTLEEAVDAVDEVERNYKWHSRAALAIAREFFDYRVVLGKMLDQLGARPGSSIRAFEPRDATCILGVEQDSTSVVGRLVELVGAGGQPGLRTAFERELIEVNDALLHRFGGDDREQPQFPVDWERSAAVADLYLRARAAVALNPDDDLLFGAADPRFALTLPFWRRVLPQLRCIVCVRDPLGAARALVDTGRAASLPAAAEFWCRCTEAALRSSDEERRILVFSEDLHRQPEVELSRVADFLGRSEAAADPEVARALRDTLDAAGGPPVSGVDALEEPALSFAAKSLFLTLRLLRVEGAAERRDLAAAVTALAALGVAEAGRELGRNHPAPTPDEEPRRAACTIISKNYLAHARVLAESFHAVHPDVPFFVLLVDRNDGSISPTREVFEVIELEELDVPDLLRLCFQYSVIELNTAVKPYLLAHLMEHREIDRLIYFDPDILVVDRLSEAWDLLDKHSIVLTPHLTEPVEDDGKKPSEIDILLSGTYNLGFLGLARSEATRRLLTWWQERLYDRCVVAHDEGLFTDQRWMDLVPGFFDDAYVLREPGYNVAYWNLHSRRVSAERDRVRVNGKPAVFFHFSGLDPHAPLGISRHQNRFRLDELGDLAQIFDRYRKLLFAAGYEALKGQSYAFATFDNGVAIPDIARSLYRRLGSDALRFGDPFATAPVGSFFRWLNAPVPDDALSERPITQLWYEVYGLRPDVRHEFPDLFGDDRTGFLYWAGSTGLDELGIDPALLPGARGEAAITARVPGANGDRRFGVNVAGYFASEKGMGEAVRSDVRLLRTAGIPFSIDEFVDAGSVNAEAVARSFDGNPYGFNLVHVNADQLPAFAASRAPDYFEGRYTIGYWTWELSNFPPDWRRSFAYVDEVWVPSTFTLDSIARGATKPVLRIPHVLEPDAPIARSRRPDFGLPEDVFLFLFMFDFHSFVERKNPFGLIEAFKRAFRPAEHVGLVLKCSHSEYEPELLEALRYAAGGARVHFVDAVLTRPQVRALISLADAYVSLHRSEGFGLTMAEAMALGKPVVATGYSGNVDFMRPANSFLVDYELVRIERDHGPYPKGSLWADPDLEQAAQLLRSVVDQPGIAAERSALGRRNVLRELDPEAVGRIASQRLIDIADLRWPATPSKATAARETALPVYDALVQRIRETVAGVVPSQSELAVVSRGDEQLLLLGDRRCSHFPCTPSGVYAGHHPADDDDAIAQVEKARETGVEYLVFPATASWWLEHYRRLREHLENKYAQLVEDPDTCVIYHLTAPRAAVGTDQLIDDVAEATSIDRGGATLDEGYASLVEEVRDRIRQTIPSDSEIAIISKGDEALVEVNGYGLRHFPCDGNGDYAGYYPGDSRAAIGELEATRERGVRYLVVPKTAFWWLGFYIEFAQHLRDRYPLLHTSSDCLIYELAPAASVNGRGKLSRLLPRRGPHR